MSCKNTLKEEYYKNLENFINKLPEKKGELIKVLHKGQEIFGYLPEEVQKFIAEKMELSFAKVYGVVSFYHYFTMVPRGKYPISVCLGTACYVRGAKKIRDKFVEELGIEEGEVSKDGLFSLDILRCIGACGLAPVVLIGEEVHGKIEFEDVSEIIKNYRSKG